MNTHLLHLEPIQQFVKAVGKDVLEYFGKDPGCIVYLKPDGTFYGVALCEWLSEKKKNLTLTTMTDDGEGLEEKKVKGRKVLIVDNDIVTGKGYKRSMEALRIRKEKLAIRDIKFAVFADRSGLADFSVGEYSAGAVWDSGNLDAVDLKIISFVGQDGRMSFTQIGKKLKISGVSVKNRVLGLLHNQILSVQGMLKIGKFYTISAGIHIDADQKTVERLAQNLEAVQEVYHLVKSSSGGYTLAIGVLARTVAEVEEFVEKHIRPLPGIRRIDIHIGDLPLIPNSIPPKLR